MIWFADGMGSFAGQLLVIVGIRIESESRSLDFEEMQQAACTPLPAPRTAPPAAECPALAHRDHLPAGPPLLSAVHRGADHQAEESEDKYCEF